MKLQSLRTYPEYLAIDQVRAIDGDTIEAVVHLPLNVAIRRRIRLKGFFAPEHKGANPDGAHAAQALLQRACDQSQCHIQTHGMKDDRYGRLAATLFLNGHAVHGGLVLGHLQLTPDAHREEVKHAREAASRAGG